MVNNNHPVDIPKTYTVAYSDEAKIKGETSEKKERFQKGSYHNFLCKCREGFDTFSEFLDHVKDFHKIENLNFSEILAKKNRSEWGIKFYWSLSCKCGNAFSSSLCNADLRISDQQIQLLKKYKLRCLKCKNYAEFNKKESLEEFLKERVKQKLIYSFYREKFAEFESEWDSEKKLEGHIQELCEKCQLLGSFCGGT